MKLIFEKHNFVIFRTKPGLVAQLRKIDKDLEEIVKLGS